jgi:RWD domain
MYPEVIPKLSLSLAATSPRSTISKEQYSDILTRLETAAVENLGMAMIFTIASILKEILEELLVSVEAKEREAARLTEAREKQQLLEQIESQILGIRRTPVTYELFLEWKAKFDSWKAEQKKKGNDVENVRGRNREKEKREEGRLNGREVFQRMKSEAGEGFEEGEEDGLVEREEHGEEVEMGAVVDQTRELRVEAELGMN